MGAEQIRERLHLCIEQADERLLRVLGQFAETLFEEYHSGDSAIIGYYPEGEGITVSELKAKILRAEEQIDSGVFLTHEQLQKESMEWLDESARASSEHLQL